MQVDDMGATEQAVRNLEVISGKKSVLTSDERSQLRHATGLLRMLSAERQELLKARAAVREEVNRPKPCERVRLPDDRKSVTRKFNVRTGDDSLKIYATVGHYPDGRPGELFLKCDKQGSLLSGAFDAVALTMSIGLQYGIPLDVFVSKFVGMRFEPAGFTGDKKYPICTSVLDLVARWLKDTSA